MEQELFQKRTDLIIDYISQILVYGSNIKGTLSLDKNHFDDGNYLILTVNDLGIPVTNSISFYDFVLKAVLDKFKTFTITFYNDDSILISSSVNHNQITLHFTFTNQKEKNWFNRKEKKFYNNKCK